MEWYLGAWQKYAAFSGRARRQEYWMFVLINTLVILGLSLIDTIAGIGILGLLYNLASLVPNLSVAVRRLHDTNRSGWWLLIGLIPLIGAIVLFVFMLLDGNEGENEYGPSPKAYAAE